MGAQRCEHDHASRIGHVRRSAYELLLRLAQIHRNEPQAAARRVGSRRYDRCNDTRIRGAPELFAALDLQTCRGQTLRDRLRVIGKLGTELTEPSNGGLHCMF